MWKSAVEMPGGGRRWKTLVSRYKELAARHRVSHRRPPPLEIANGAISTFPQRRRSFPLFTIQTARVLRALAETLKKGDFQQQTELPSSGSSRIGMKGRFQAHLALESNLDFRLISGLENAPFCSGLVSCSSRVASSKSESASNRRGGIPGQPYGEGSARSVHSRAMLNVP